MAAATYAGVLPVLLPSAVSAPPAAKKPPRDSKPRPPRPAEDEEPPAAGAANRLLTKKEIHRIRFMELRTLREN